MKWYMIGLVGIVFLFLFSQPSSLPSLTIDSNVTIFDTNKVSVTQNDTTADYLFSKLQAGNNITLTVQNSGGDENILISSTASGGGGGNGTTYTSGTPSTIQVNNDTNTISQNFDGNFYNRLNALVPWADANLSTLSWTKLQNYPTGCGAFLSVQTIGDTLTCISVPSETNIDANALAVVNSLDLNNSLSYAKVDTNCSTSNDCNNNYIQKFPSALQIISCPTVNCLDLNGAVRPLVTRQASLGTNARIWGQVVAGTFNCQDNMGVDSNCLQIPSNRYAFEIEGQDGSGLYFSGVRRGIEGHSSGKPIFRLLLTGSSEGALFIQGLATPPAGNAIDTNGLIYMRDYGDSNQFNIRKNDQWVHINTDMNLGNPNNGQNDANWMGDIDHNGDFNVLSDLGVGHQILGKTGTNACFGADTLGAGGTVVVNTTCVNANSLIFLTGQNGSANIGSIWVSARTAGTSFTISSTNVLDNRLVAWQIIEPIN